MFAGWLSLDAGKQALEKLNATMILSVASHTQSDRLQYVSEQDRIKEFA